MFAFRLAGHSHLRETRLLEVGALKADNYEGIPWIQVKPIDLHSQHPSIEEQDFLLFDETTNTSTWDVISLSLVINFVPQPKDRGKFQYLHRFPLP